ncbi:hypothetical protein [Paenibacillus sonchi]|nr:hypothetical protein [Paenibacillus sonchi]
MEQEAIFFSHNGIQRTDVAAGIEGTPHQIGGKHSMPVSSNWW